VHKWITDLVKDIDMEPIGEPRIEYTAAEFPDKAGFTAIQIIVTSSIVAHFIDSTGDVYIDVFSCKPFDNDTVIKSIQEAFRPKKIRPNYLTRQAG
jgi:S-adenosylmethionine decarboxylase